jgi:hypothetical protein
MPNDSLPIDSSDSLHPKVFISYSWGAKNHKSWVLALANKLRRNGIDCWIDQFEEKPDGECPSPRWMVNKLRLADHILLVCSEPYYKEYLAYINLQDPENTRGKGVAWEIHHAIQEIYDTKAKTKRLIPIYFNQEDERYIPETFRPFRQFKLFVKNDHITEDDYKLLWMYLANHGVEPEPLGELTLPPLEEKERTKDFEQQYSIQMAIMKGWAEISPGCKDPDRRIDVVFVHGIIGDLYSAWQPQDEDTNGFWLQWLGEEMPGAGIWSLSYEVQSIRWQGSVAPLAPITNKLLRDLIDLGIGQRPIIFIGHDLGGFVVKEILHNSLRSAYAELKKVWEYTRGVAFLSSPCSAQINSIMDWIEFLTQTLSEIDFGNHSNKTNLANFLSRLNTDFWDSCKEKHGFKPVSCYPNQPLNNKQIIDSETEILELQSAFDFVDTVDILNMNHSSICKPRLRDEQICREIRRLILDQSLTRTSKSGSRFRIKKSEGDEPYLLNESPANTEYNVGDPSHDIDNYEIVMAWKTVHFLSEVLYARFLEFRDDIIRWKEASDAIRDDIYSYEKVKEYINNKIIGSTKDALRRVNGTVLDKVETDLSPVINSGSLEPISESEYVKFLYNFSDCCEAVKEAIGIDSEKAYELTMTLTKWLYNSLHTADQILKQAFDHGVLSR